MAMTHAVLLHKPHFWGFVALQAHLIYARVSLGMIVHFISKLARTEAYHFFLSAHLDWKLFHSKSGVI